MAGSTSKKVLILRFDRSPVPGFVHSQGFTTATGIELLTPAGTVLIIPYDDAKVVYFVKDWDEDPPLLDGQFFSSRPKSAGLWARMTFRDGMQMDGLMSSNLLQIEPFGFVVTPPGQMVNPAKIFIPRAALSDLRILAVVGSGLKSGRRKIGEAKAKEVQLPMFE